MNTSHKIPLWVVLVAAFAIAVLGTYLIVRLSPVFLANLGLQADNKLEEAPAFTLKDVNGGEVSLLEFRGQPVILSFWTSWNEAAVEELQTLAAYAAVQGGRLTILAINNMEDENTVQEIKNRYKLNIRMLLDEDGSVGEAYKIGVLPKTVFIDSGGLKVFESERPLSLVEIRQQVQKMQ